MKRYARIWLENIKKDLFSGIESLSEKPHEGFSTDEKKIEFCQKLQREREGVKKGYNRVLEKIKDIRQRFSTAVTTGSRSGSGKIILEYYDKLVLVWGGSAAVEPLNYRIDSSCVTEYSTNGENIANESNTSTSSRSSSNNDIASGSSTGNGINSTDRFNQETTEATFLYNNNKLSDSETDPVVKKIKRNPIPKLINDKRKHLQKKTRCFRSRLHLEKILSSSEIWQKRFVNQMNYLLSRLKS